MSLCPPNVWHTVAACGLALVSILIGAGCRPAETVVTQPAPSVAVEPPMPEQPVVAAPGVAKQGQSLKNETGIGRMIVQPAVTLFAVRERAVFEIQIPQAMQLWEASNGRKPKSHEEFMDQVIKANNIKLPELPEGKIYRYHPDDAQLYVHPANE